MASTNSNSVNNNDEHEMDVSSSFGQGHGHGQQEQMDGIDEDETYKTDEATDLNDGENSTKVCILKMLDEMDGRVEKMRSDALKVEAERDDILTSLDTLNNSQLVHNLGGIELDEITRYIKRLAQRSAAVRVEISTERSVNQQESLHVVNTLIDSLIREVKSDVMMARRRCISYLNACSDGAESLNQEYAGIDAAFEEAVLGCTLEDQKRVKKRLNGLFSYFSTYSPILSEIKEESEDCQKTVEPSSSITSRIQ